MYLFTHWTLLQFLSTPSARRATPWLKIISKYRYKFLSTPSARRATFVSSLSSGSGSISIHALREEGDVGGGLRRMNGIYFYPRPPRGGRPQRQEQDQTGGQDFYPRPPRGGRLTIFFHNSPPYKISIHALREEGDSKNREKTLCFCLIIHLSAQIAKRSCKTNRKITPLLVQTAGIPVRSVRENHVRCLFALAGHQKISTLSCANSGCSPTCSTLVW